MGKVHAWNFQCFLFRLGLREFFRGFYYFKFLEYPLVYNNLNFNSKSLYLDIGSGKSCFPLFVLMRDRPVVHIADDQSNIHDSFNHYHKTLQNIKLKHLLNKNVFIHNINKGELDLHFPDNYFDAISCISTVEHAKNDGDIKTIKTIARILKKGARAVVTFPFSNGSYVEEDDNKEIGYFQRRYNIAEIQKRLVMPSNLKVSKVTFFGERHLGFGQMYLTGRFKKFYWLVPFFSPLLWRVCYSYEGDFRNYHEPGLDKEGIGVACIVFEKNR